MPFTPNRYFVYILANKGRMLYTGSTNDLVKRVWQHRNGLGSEYTKRYSTHSLVWFDETNDVHEAITRERQIKEWRRRWKVELIEEKNPTWNDLASDRYE